MMGGCYLFGVCLFFLCPWLDCILSKRGHLPATHHQGWSVSGLEVETEGDLFGEKNKMKPNQGSRRQMGWAHGEQEMKPVQRAVFLALCALELRATGPLPCAYRENGSSLSLSCPDLSLLPIASSRKRSPQLKKLFHKWGQWA